jgi:short-subunit dehydrogenase
LIKMSETKIKYAMVTGASKGIGRSMAIALAKRKINLLLIARSVDELSALQADIKKQYGVEVHVLSIDLSQPQAPKDVLNWVLANDYEISILINNAGYGLWGKFAELDLAAPTRDVPVEYDYRYFPMPFIVAHTFKRKSSLYTQRIEYCGLSGSTNAGHLFGN